MEQLKSNAECLGEALKELLSAEDDSNSNRSYQDDFTTKALELSKRTLEECTAGQAKFLLHIRSTLRNLFSRKRNHAMDSPLIQNQHVSSERAHDSGLDVDDLGDVLLGLQSVESDGLYQIIGLRSIEEPATEEIEIVYMPQDGPTFTSRVETNGCSPILRDPRTGSN